MVPYILRPQVLFAPININRSSAALLHFVPTRCLHLRSIRPLDCELQANRPIHQPTDSLDGCIGDDEAHNTTFDGDYQRSCCGVPSAYYLNQPTFIEECAPISGRFRINKRGSLLCKVRVLYGTLRPLVYLLY